MGISETSFPRLSNMLSRMLLVGVKITRFPTFPSRATDRQLDRLCPQDLVLLAFEFHL